MEAASILRAMTRLRGHIYWPDDARLVEHPDAVLEVIPIVV